MTRRRTIWDALHDKLVDLVDSYDVTQLLVSDGPKKKALKPKVVDTTAEDVTSASERNEADEP